MNNELTDEKEVQSIDTIPLYRKKRVIIPIFLLIIAAIIITWYWYVGLRGFISTDDAYIDGNRVSISSKILGRIIRLTVDEGANVQQGQALVYLDDTDLRAQEEQSKAVLEQAQQNVVLAKINMEKNQEDYQRAEELFKNNINTKEKYDHSKKAFETARAQYNIALAQVEVTKSQLGVIKTQLLNTVISSPINGVVAKKWALVGDVVQPAQPIFSIYEMQNVWITANLEETKLTAIKLNDPVEIFVDAYPQQSFQGKVIQLGSNTASQFSLIPPNNASGNFTKVTQRVPIKISLEQQPSVGNSNPFTLLPGMSVEIKIKVK
jgi:membrane fusion protein (multidrug efflux system)